MSRIHNTNGRGQGLFVVVFLGSTSAQNLAKADYTYFTERRKEKRNQRRCCDSRRERWLKGQ
jgi:hypothetical protein